MNNKAKELCIKYANVFNRKDYVEQTVHDYDTLLSDIMWYEGVSTPEELEIKIDLVYGDVMSLRKSM